VIVADDYLSIAIGKGGQNVSLACEITGWHLEVTSEAEYSRELKEGYDTLMKLKGVGLPLAETLFKGGYSSLLDIAEAEVEDLIQVTGLEESRIGEIMDDAKVLLDEELNGPGPEQPLKNSEGDEQIPEDEES